MACLVLVCFFLLVRDIHRSQSFVRKSKMLFFCAEMSSILGRVETRSIYMFLEMCDFAELRNIFFGFRDWLTSSSIKRTRTWRRNLRLDEVLHRKLRNCLQLRLYSKRVVSGCSITWCAAMSSVLVKELNGGEEFRAANIVELFLSLTLILVPTRFLSKHLRFFPVFSTHYI